MTRVLTLTFAALLSVLPVAAEAHRAWLLPSTTVLSGEDPWITVDAAVSNTLFVFEHHPLRLDGLTLTGPDGKPIAAQNQAAGKFRSTFDMPLAEDGTYRIAVVSAGYFARYELEGERKRWRGTREQIATGIPAAATNVALSKFDNRIETFVTLGAPSKDVLAPSNAGLEMVALTHPNDLYAGETAKFRFLLDGAPAADVEVEVVQGGGRYRSEAGDRTFRTDADGMVEIAWPEAGRYWIGADIRSDEKDADGATRRAGYTATLEVLPQ